MILENCKHRFCYRCHDNHLPHPQSKGMCSKSRHQFNFLKLGPRKREWPLRFWGLGPDPKWLVLLVDKDETPSHVECGYPECQSAMGGQPQMKDMCESRKVVFRDIKPANTWTLNYPQDCEKHKGLGRVSSVVVCDGSQRKW